MFVERLFSVLSWPSEPWSPAAGSAKAAPAPVSASSGRSLLDDDDDDDDDADAVDAALESRTLPARQRFAAELESRVLDGNRSLDEARAAWLVDLCEEGWLDEHLLDLHDVLLELCPELPGAAMERLIRTAMFSFFEEASLDSPELPVRSGATLTEAELALLRRATQLVTGGACESQGLGLSRFVWRYARALGLLELREGREPGAVTCVRTPLGDSALRLTGGRLLPFLLGLEVRGSSGPADRYRAPRAALLRMQAAPTFAVPTTGSARRRIDPDGVLSWWRVRRLLRMGLCEAVPGSAKPEGGQEIYAFRLTRAGHAAIAETLAATPDAHPLAASAPFAATESGASAAIVPTASGPSSQPGLAASPSPSLSSVSSPAPYGSVESEVAPTPSSNPSGGGLRELEVGPLLVRAWSELKVHRVQFELCGPSVCVLADRKALLCIFRELLRAGAEAALHGASSPPSVYAQVADGGDGAFITVEMDDSGPPLPSAFLREPGLVPESSLWGVGDSSDELDLSLRRSLFRTVEDLHAQGGSLAFLPSRLGGASLRINLPRLPRLPHPIETGDAQASSGSLRSAA